MRGGRGPPPPGVVAGYHDGRSPPAEGQGPYGRRPSDGYSTDPSTNPSMPNVGVAYDPYNADNNYPRAESPPPMDGTGPVRPGQAVEMDSRSAQAMEMDAAPVDRNQGYVPYNGQIRDNDSDVAGMVGLQQGPQFQNSRHDTYMSEGSKYSTDE